MPNKPSIVQWLNCLADMQESFNGFAGKTFPCIFRLEHLAVEVHLFRQLAIEAIALEEKMQLVRECVFTVSHPRGSFRRRFLQERVQLSKRHPNDEFFPATKSPQTESARTSEDSPVHHSRCCSHA